MICCSYSLVTSVILLSLNLRTRSSSASFFSLARVILYPTLFEEAAKVLNESSLTKRSNGFFFKFFFCGVGKLTWFLFGEYIGFFLIGETLVELNLVVFSIEVLQVWYFGNIKNEDLLIGLCNWTNSLDEFMLTVVANVYALGFVITCFWKHFLYRIKDKNWFFLDMV